ncbi:hypothetical protein AA309_11490 [Microvirga vignae]|uniref:Uncharacterized protein n=1 Tax=Microvirga vignae TaxID=1225564 RepID=A0A0H1RDP0_9HYPH|nr:hypothetical protein AA309_11490 [Microvirga vignae]
MGLDAVAAPIDTFWHEGVRWVRQEALERIGSTFIESQDKCRGDLIISKGTSEPLLIAKQSCDTEVPEQRASVSFETRGA